MENIRLNCRVRFRNRLIRAVSRSTAEGQSGQVMVMVAVFLVGLIAIMALVYDGGGIYLHRRHMQNAADAGALAGTRALCQGLSAAQAEVEAQSYSGANGATSTQVTINANGVTAVSCTSAQMTFAQIIGLGAVNVCARASAECVPLSEWNHMAPIGILWQNFYVGQCIDIWDDEVEYDDLTGNTRGWLNVSCYSATACCCGSVGGAAVLKDWITGVDAGTIQIPSYLYGDNGTIAAAIMAFEVGQDYRVPVYDFVVPDEHGHAYYHVFTLALFHVTGVYSGGNPKGIHGCFQEWLGPGEPGSGQDLGVRTIRLTE